MGVSASDNGLKMSSFQSQELVNSMGRIIPRGSPLSLVNSVCFQNGLPLFHPSLFLIELILPNKTNKKTQALKVSTTPGQCKTRKVMRWFRHRNLICLSSWNPKEVQETLGQGGPDLQPALSLGELIILLSPASLPVDLIKVQEFKECGYKESEGMKIKKWRKP